MIEEQIKARKRLEMAITDLCHKFEIETGLEVRSIDLTEYPTVLGSTSFRHGIHVDAALPTRS